MKNFLISIIVPVYNAEEYLNECVDSLINQTYHNIEIILVNDGSTDSSLKICNDYKKRDNRVVVIDKKNGGPSTARNTGITNAKGKYILFVDSDDWIETNMIETMVANDINKYDMVICSFTEVYSDRKEKVTVEKCANLEEYIFESNARGFICSKLIRKDCIEHLFLENICLLEDMIFWIDNMENIKNIKLVNKSLYNYRIVESSLIHSTEINKKRLSILNSYMLLIEKIPQKYKIQYMVIYLDHYYLYYNYIYQDNELKQNYKEYFKIVISNKNVKIIKKIKLIVKRGIIIFKYLFMGKK